MRNQLINLMGVSLYVICCFSLSAFYIFIFLFNFCQFDYCVSQCVPPWVYPVWDSGFLGFRELFFSPILRKFSTIISSSICSCPFFLSSSSGTPIIQISGHLTVSERSLRLC